ncbi:bifunctional folylpolyglutamate synthase/dihydrofolate synthase [Bacteroidota bacterium]
MYQRIGKTAFKKNLSNTLALCRNLDNPQNDFKSIHIAGTNGKGSSAHMISAVLQSAGYRVGLYTSPHIKDFTERICINGQSIPEHEVADFVDQNQNIISRINPSFFEVTVVMAFYYFAKQEVDLAIIETGLGGRLDSTNVIVPAVSLITNIGMDHQEMLGDSLPEIAFEKAGIIKNGIPVIICTTQNQVADVFINKAEELKSPIIFAEEELSINRLENCEFELISGDTFYPSIIRLDLKGDYQQKNLPGVLVTLKKLSDCEFAITHENIIEGLGNITRLTGLKGRWQILSRGKPLIVCDVAHNEDGIRAIMNQLENTQSDKKHIVWGMVNDKDTGKLLNLLPKDALYYFCEAQIPRALKVEKLKTTAESIGLVGNSYPSVSSATAEAKKHATDNDLIFIGGSTFVVAEIDEL